MFFARQWLVLRRVCLSSCPSVCRCCRRAALALILFACVLTLGLLHFSPTLVVAGHYRRDCRKSQGPRGGAGNAAGDARHTRGRAAPYVFAGWKLVAETAPHASRSEGLVQRSISNQPMPSFATHLMCNDDKCIFGTGRPFTPNGPHIALEVAGRLQAAVIGRGGATITDLQEQSGCRINLDRETGMCYIVGKTEEAMEKAKVSRNLTQTRLPPMWCGLSASPSRCCRCRRTAPSIGVSTAIAVEWVPACVANDCAYTTGHGAGDRRERKSPRSCRS